MKNSLMSGPLALLILVALAACGSGEKETETAVEATPAEQAPGEEQVVAEEESAIEEDSTQVVVEESAAEPEDDEKPIMLARADSTDTAARDWKFKEGQHYIRMVPSQPTMGGADKIEVAEFFWYGCPHCFSFEPTINAWAAEIPANARFVRIPVVWNNVHELHARLFYTMEVLDRNGTLADGETFHNTVFQEIQTRGNRLTSEDSIRRLFERFGVDADAFNSTWKSFEVDQKLRVAKDLGRRYSIQGVPAVVVNGKYRTGGAEAGSYDAVPDVIDELITRESQR
ncbi:MAG: thiol:disulfide interchange protein DsbA/DsbL [Gammaproteobacteria bacterium]|jgi:thiol:disulfide interchange protein DsbA|nr:thiol:disulfide interchange protein DsbA/DsbL [Gammaproteobacteria bacterium]MDH3848032.1 thiol:disulfide interchange protein DsbA/DsbL [Gammaproteobacteria bacterium]MDH3865270.1 thiol:disulfide interchange protein DsbA/DsbL [Gammaproteobacteria bacterium]MDH3905821.1 thiol:disulfide interchange protein DsbA/DsbL [Gammaproteobacteria bacterium]MDH4004025.1 thiol:disulfide interchange protein DsbA/DsbL [Gammaproteobacteria bacterium]